MPRCFRAAPLILVSTVSPPPPPPSTPHPPSYITPFRPASPLLTEMPVSRTQIKQELPPSPPPTPRLPSPVDASLAQTVAPPMSLLPAVDVEYLPQFDDINVDQKPWLNGDDLSSVMLDAFFQPLAPPVF